LSYLCAPQYVLGEIAEDHTALPGFAERVRRLRMQPSAALWGWGTVHRTERDLADLAVETGRATLRAARLDPLSVDALVLCSTRFPGGPETHGRLVGTILTGLGLDRAAFTGVTLNRCTNLLAAIDMADALVSSGRYGRVLVITTDRAGVETDRLETFALFSDGAASCVVTGDPGIADSYEIMSGASAQDARNLDWSGQISADLAREVNDAILKPLDLRLDQIHGVLHTNLFRPLVTMKERLAGFRAEQLYTANIPRVGHCFAADPLINLVDRATAGELLPDHHYLLVASVPGERRGVLVHARTTIRPEIGA